DAAAGMLWLSIAILWGIVIADAVNLTPPAMQLLPFLPARLRRPVAALGLVGFTLTVVAIGLLFLAGQLVIDGYAWPLASEALSLIQGMLLAGATVCAIPALILGLAAVAAVGCALIALVCAALSHLLGVARQALVLASEAQPSLIHVTSATGRSLWNAA